MDRALLTRAMRKSFLGALVSFLLIVVAIVWVLTITQITVFHTEGQILNPAFWIDALDRSGPEDSSWQRWALALGGWLMMAVALIGAPIVAFVLGVRGVIRRLRRGFALRVFDADDTPDLEFTVTDDEWISSSLDRD